MKAFRLSKKLLICLATVVATCFNDNCTGAGNDPQPANRIVLVGDSTLATRTGWGDAFAKLASSGAECINMGRGGRSSKSYREEGHWKKVLELKPGWVLIQFGHNDQPGKGPERETDAKTTFRENLIRYVAEARAIGAKPVLITSLTRRNFNAEGKIVPSHLEPMSDSSDKAMPDFLNDYVEATRAVAAQQHVPLIDLNARSIETLNRLGPASAAKWNAKRKNSAEPDTTHLSATGAAQTAQLVREEIRKNIPGLAPLLATRVPADSTALPATQPADDRAALPEKTAFHIYLLMGQSNMAGRDTNTLADQVPNPRVLALDTNGQWVIARDPLHPDHGTTKAGIGPGISFALEMLKTDTNATIGLIPCAVGGTPLKRWMKGADLYENALARAKRAAQSGTICGVLWHQGESDTREKEDADTYQPRLAAMFEDLRRDLGISDLPIVVGQLGSFLPTNKWPYADTVRAALKDIPLEVPHLGYADSKGLVHKGDHLHFSAEAQQKFGIRYARAMQQLQKSSSRPNPASTAPSAVFGVWPDGKMPGSATKEAEKELPSKDRYHRVTNVSRPKLKLFSVPKMGAPAPAFLICPGGGYDHVVVDKEGSEIAEWLNSNGITAVVLTYRVPTNRAGALQDVERSLSLVRAHAGEWNVDPNRLGIIGFSAGGNLAAKASTLFAQRAYAPIDGVDQESCRPDFAVLVYPAYLDDTHGDLAPDLNLQARIPPTLIIHNEDDKKYAPGSKLYAAALDHTAAVHELKLYSSGGHGYGLHCTGTASEWPGFTLQWLHKNSIR